jgi:glutaredoxin
MYHARRRNTSRNELRSFQIAPNELKRLRFFSLFSVLSLCPPNPGKALTQRTQRKAERLGRAPGCFAERLNWDTNSGVMDAMEREILAVFDRRGPRVHALADFGAHSGVQDCLLQLVERGWLRRGEAPDTFLRTEDGRFQLAGPRDATIYSRPGCHLCEEAKAQIAPLLKAFDARLTEVNIDDDPELRARYDHDVPVIFLGARKVAKHRIDIAQFRRQLRNASTTSE